MSSFFFDPRKFTRYMTILRHRTEIANLNQNIELEGNAAVTATLRGQVTKQILQGTANDKRCQRRIYQRSDQLKKCKDKQDCKADTT